MTDRVEFQGEIYRRMSGRWINAKTYTAPPLVISQRLDQLFPVATTSQSKHAQKGSRPKGSAGHDFAGLRESDFRRDTSGTNWRGRNGLGGMLAQRLSDITGRDFRSHAVYRRAIVLIGEPPRFAEGNVDKLNYRKAKFSFRLDEQAASYGFYVEKSDKPMNSEWEWPSFLGALLNQSVTERISIASRDHDLHWVVELYANESEHEPHAAFQVTPSQPLRRGQMPMSWEQFAAELGGLRPNEWCDLKLHHVMPKTDAIARGVNIVEPVVKTFEALLPLYDACGSRAVR